MIAVDDDLNIFLANTIMPNSFAYKGSAAHRNHNKRNPSLGSLIFSTPSPESLVQCTHLAKSMPRYPWIILHFTTNSNTLQPLKSDTDKWRNHFKTLNFPLQLCDRIVRQSRRPCHFGNGRSPCGPHQDQGWASGRRANNGMASLILVMISWLLSRMIQGIKTRLCLRSSWTLFFDLARWSMVECHQAILHKLHTTKIVNSSTCLSCYSQFPKRAVNHSLYSILREYSFNHPMSVL